MDSDNLADYRLSGGDPGCSGLWDTTEVDGHCDDLIDNDGDTHTDFGVNGDSGCLSYSDNDESPRDFCSDTDNGINQNTKGTITGEDKNVQFSYTDVCIDSNNLNEYYCGGINDDYDPLSQTINCQYGCENGACKTSPVTTPGCGDDICDISIGESCSTCANDCGQCPVETHKECDFVNQKCVVVQGAGSDQCQFDYQCVPPPSTADIAVINKVLGQTTKGIGFSEGNRFNINNLIDSNAGSYRIWYGMDRFQNTWGGGTQYIDLAGNYGEPTIAQIKAVLNDRVALESLINLKGIDERMRKDLWNQGASFKEQMHALKSNGIIPVITLRNKDKSGSPTGAPPRNGFPLTDADKNEIWHNAFGSAYWSNVLDRQVWFEKNSKGDPIPDPIPKLRYNIEYWQVHNEPSIDMPKADRGATEQDYVEFTYLIWDAVKTANDLVNQQTKILASVDVPDGNGPKWLTAAMKGENTKGYFITATDYHYYQDFQNHNRVYPNDIAAAKGTFKIVKDLGKIKPLVLSEWVTHTDDYNKKDGNGNFPYANQIAKSSFDFAQLQKDDPTLYMELTHVFCGDGPWGEFNCLVNNGQKTASYYAFRNVARCLGDKFNDPEVRNFYQLTKDSNSVLVAKEGSIVYISSVNYGKTFTIDLSQIGKTSGTASVYEFSSAKMDILIETKQVNNGILQLTTPSQGSICVVVN